MHQSQFFPILDLELVRIGACLIIDKDWKIFNLFVKKNCRFNFSYVVEDSSKNLDSDQPPRLDVAHLLNFFLKGKKRNDLSTICFATVKIQVTNYYDKINKKISLFRLVLIKTFIIYW